MASKKDRQAIMKGLIDKFSELAPQHKDTFALLANYDPSNPNSIEEILISAHPGKEEEIKEAMKNSDYIKNMANMRNPFK